MKNELESCLALIVVFLLAFVASGLIWGVVIYFSWNEVLMNLAEGTKRISFNNSFLLGTLTGLMISVVKIKIK